MSNRIFTSCTDLSGNNETQSFKVLSSNFGDGYEQHTSVGINNKQRQWSYQRTALKAEIDEIAQFFDDHKGADSFIWQYNGLRVKTDASYQKVHVGGLYWRISTTFTQQF